MSRLHARGSALEYWFVKVHTPGLAFLVDLIVRRRGEADVRLSYWNGGHKRVSHELTRDWSVGTDGVRVGTSRIGRGRCVGASAGVEWDLSYRPGPRWLQPGRAFSMLRVPDMQIESSPGARFDGVVRIASEAFRFEDAPGLVSHYWGRRLPDRWVWLSLTDGTREVESVVARTRVWGLPWPRVDMGYAYAADASGSRSVTAGVNGILSADVRDETVRVRARGLFAQLALEATSPTRTRNDLGEGIAQTLLGDLRVDGASMHGTAGVETRGWG